MLGAPKAQRAIKSGRRWNESGPRSSSGPINIMPHECHHMLKLMTLALGLGNGLVGGMF